MRPLTPETAQSEEANPGHRGGAGVATMKYQAQVTFTVSRLEEVQVRRRAVNTEW
jgi:hypothetical protein